MDFSNDSQTLGVKEYKEAGKVKFYSMNSRELSIYVVKVLSSDIEYVSTELLQRKCVRIPFQSDSFLCISMLNN